MIAASHYFLFHRKDLVALMHKSEIKEGPPHEIRNTSCLGSRCGGKEDVAAAARRRRKILQSRTFFHVIEKCVKSAFTCKKSIP